jgi:hypothetical protein
MMGDIAWFITGFIFGVGFCVLIELGSDDG